MDSVEWKKEYELGIETIDDQHRELFKRINKLTLSLYSGKGKDELRSIIQYLKSYIEEHFSSEETLFDHTDYPDVQKHKEKHKQFIDFFITLDHEIKSRGADNFLAIKVEKEIRNWWNEHESQFDRKYVPYVK